MQLQAWLPKLATAFAFAPSLAWPAQANPISRQLSGSFSVLEDEPAFTFEYSVTAEDSTHWIGIYDAAGGGPEDETQDEEALIWEYTPGSEGSVFISASSLEPGTYKAFFLASDGYEWLAEPFELDLPESQETFDFIVSDVTLQNARQGDEFEADISGLLNGQSQSGTDYTITSSSGHDWAEISSSGTISGTPDTGNGLSEWTVEAKSSDGSVAELTVTIPVRGENESLVEELQVMTYNLWFGGTRVSDYHQKQVRFLVESNVDIVGLQESTPDHATRLAEALGWDVWQNPDIGVISRYPIDHVYPALGSYSGGVRVNLDGQCSQVNVWNVHLGHDPYGPYDFCFDGMSVDEVLEREAESSRTPQIVETIEAMEEQLSNSDSVPVILLGDFNAPSHLDWTEALEDKNCGYSDVPWPTSEYPINAGMVDTFRVAHPDPAENEGITWSPIFLENDGRSEPLDRIDFIYHKSDFEVLASEDLVAGSPSPQPGHANNEWTSDHAAVMTTFKLSGERC